MQFKTIATLAIASLAVAAPIAEDSAAGAVQGGAAQGQSGSTVVEETEAGSQQASNPLGAVGALAAAILGCFTGWAGGI